MTQDDTNDNKEYYGIGSGRRRSLDALEQTPYLDPIESFDSLEDMVEAIKEIHVVDYSKPPEDTIKKLKHFFGRLPGEQAERYYLNDYKLTRTVNAARRAFNDWVSRKKRYDQMPGTMEAGPSNYPVKKHRKRRDSERKGREKLDEKLDRLNGRTKGAFRRALKKAGYSEAELNEQKRGAKRQEWRDTLEKGSIVLSRTIGNGWEPWAVKRVNKKSVRLRRPHGSAGQPKPMSDDVYPEYDEDTVQLDSDFLKGPLDPERFGEQAEDIRDGMDPDIPADYHEAQEYLLGEEVGR